ncbi:MAG: hypothetical protein R3E56_17510 [Burkholderiaceae bacterium]
MNFLFIFREISKMISRLSELPDMLAVAMRRAGDLARAATGAQVGRHGLATTTTGRWRFVGHGDLCLLLNPAAAGVPRPAPQTQWALVWLRVAAQRTWRASAQELCPMNAERLSSCAESVCPGQRAVLIDFAVRLLLACGQTAPGGLVLVSLPPPAACAAARLLMQAIAGDAPTEFSLHDEPNAPRVWACHWRPGGHGLTETTGEPCRPVASPGLALKAWLRVASRPEQGALVLRPDPAALAVLQAWQGPCTISHTDPLVLALLRERMVLDLWRAGASPGAPPVARDVCACAAWTFDEDDAGRSRSTG